jgi:8-oxo-dGTP pyrophosphatase MutT (NUDIX family)
MMSLSPLPPAAEIGDLIAEVLTRTTPVLLTSDSRKAAVLIALYDRDGAPHVVLTRRSADLPHHPGQVSLPGGRYEIDDEDLEATALRETHEELGIPASRVRLLGRLDDVHARGSDHNIAPFVGVLDGPLMAIPSDREIARVIEVPLHDLLTADEALPADADDDVAILRYPLLDEDVWGATARILRRFSRVLRCSLSRS